MKTIDARMHGLAILAEGIAEDYFGTDPVNPQDIIESQNDLTYSVDDYGDYFDGQLHYESDQFHIFCNSEQRTKGRQRFTLAHELGHYFIDEHRLWLMRHKEMLHRSFCLGADNRPGWPVEYEADYFASHLLMPTFSLKKKIRSPSPNAQEIVDAAMYFQSSISAMALRMTEMEFFPCVVLAWGPDGRHRWTRVSPWMLKTYGGSVWRKTLKGLNQSATARVLNNPSGMSTVEEAPTVLDVWYPGLQQRMDNHKWQFTQCAVDAITEFAINLGSYGALTVLTGHDLYRKWIETRSLK